MSKSMNRGRRLRTTPSMRALVRETHVTLDDLIYPMFVQTGSTQAISSMPGILRFNLDDACREIDELLALGLRGVILFGIPDFKDEIGSGAYDPHGIIPSAIRRIRQTAGRDLVISADVCMCEYTSHGHCGLVHGGDVDNDSTLELLARASVEYANAGADVIAPSDMMDGRIGAIRSAMDGAGHASKAIMAYSAKYSSAFYGPFREAADSAPQFGDRRTYQMDPPNRREAIKEVLYDIEEGADIVMVKPALAYLDIIREVRDLVEVPVAAYNVSGEYSMLMAAAQQGWIDKERTILETLTSIKRAGADIILSYHAKEFAELRLWER